MIFVAIIFWMSVMAFLSMVMLVAIFVRVTLLFSANGLVRFMVFLLLISLVVMS